MFKLSSFGSWGLQEVPGEQRGEALSKIGTVTEDRKGHSNSQRGTSGDRRDQGEPVTCTAEFTIRKKQLSHHGECGKVIGKKKRSSLRLPAAEGQVSDPYLTLYSNKFVWGRGDREMNGDTEKKKELFKRQESRERTLAWPRKHWKQVLSVLHVPGSASAGAGCLTTWELQASNPERSPEKGGGGVLVHLAPTLVGVGRRVLGEVRSRERGPGQTRPRTPGPAHLEGRGQRFARAGDGD